MLLETEVGIKNLGEELQQIRPMFFKLDHKSMVLKCFMKDEIIAIWLKSKIGMESQEYEQESDGPKKITLKITMKKEHF